MVLALFADGQPRRKSQVAVEIGSNRGVAIRAVDDLVRNGFLRRMDDGRFCLA
jgi:DNA-binding IclR family transcriptional regulator